MVYILFAAGLLVVCNGVMLAGALLVAHRYIERKQRSFDHALRDWIEAQGENRDQPSKLALVLSSAGEVVGTAAARSIMASLAADKSHVARVANNASDELTGMQNPLLGILAGGKRGKGAAVQRLTQMLLPMFTGAGGGTGPDNGNSPRLPSVRDRLGRKEG